MQPESQTVEAWPFLIAAGRASGAAVRAAPDFLLGSGSQNMLLTVEPHWSNAIERPVRLAATEGQSPWWVAARLVEGTDASGARVTDSTRRPITVIHGVLSSSPLLAMSDLDSSVRSELDGIFHRFLDDEESEPVATIARTFEVIADNDTIRVPDPAGSGDTSEPRPKRVLSRIGAGLIVALVSLALGWRIGSGRSTIPTTAFDAVEVSSCRLTEDRSQAVLSLSVSRDVSDEASAAIVETTYVDADGRVLATSDAEVSPLRLGESTMTVAAVPDSVATSCRVSLVKADP